MSGRRPPSGGGDRREESSFARGALNGFLPTILLWAAILLVIAGLAR